MKISLIQFSIFFFVILFISGCCLGEKDKYNYVPEDRKIIYCEGDTLIYNSNFGNSDTIIYTEVEQELYVEHEFQRCNTKEFNETNWYTFSFSKKTNESRFVLIQDHIGKSVLVWLNGYSYDFRPLDPYNCEEIIVGGNVYQNVYIKHEPDRLEPYSMDNGLKTIELVFSCSKGVIQFSIEGGETWLLKSVI